MYLNKKDLLNILIKNLLKKNIIFSKLLQQEQMEEMDNFSNIFIGNQLEIHTIPSYISFKVSNENEAKSLLSYMKYKLPNFMLSLIKLSQDINETTCKWIPLPPLDKEWNDEEIYKYFKLTEDEIKLIKNTKVKGYNDIEPINVNEPKIIKEGRKQYYLINDKLYKIKKDKSKGDLFGNYINGKVIQGVDKKVILKIMK